MRARQMLAVLLASAAAALVAAPVRAVNITINGSLGDLDGNGDGGAAEANVLQTVVNCWAARVTTNRNFTLNVATANLSGGTIGQGAVSSVDGSGIPTVGGITMDTPRTYFIDGNPLDISEFQDDPNSQWRLVNGPGTDLYAVVNHEVGHAMAWLCGNPCGFSNPNYDALMNPAPGSFVSNATCSPTFPVRGQPVLAGCVHLQAGGGHPLDVPLRGDGLGGSGSSVVNELSHPGVTGDLEVGCYTNNAREEQSPEDIDLFAHAYGDTVNFPLNVAAGTDIVSECNSTGGSNITLSGAGTNDPEADTISYAWSCPGTTLSGASTATPGGFFDIGTTTTCRLEATDRAACPPDLDTVAVSVVDTTPPVITCPASVTVECTGNNGIQAADPQLAAFFTGASATDVCDASLTISNNAPLFFPLGFTTVTFSTLDDSGNPTSCAATVTVQDTIPPEISTSLDRDTLWPPNHKLVTINATVSVTDICDPNAGFTLVSITSDEPDNGLGDGDTANDIQGDEIGTADTQFQLRSERAGGGDGRVYTVNYEASDGSGNTTPASDIVTVPHDQNGWATPAEGFNITGNDFPNSAKEFRMVILSSAGFDASALDPATALVGNTVGMFRPLRSLIMDANCDGWPDLKVAYSAAEANAVKRLSEADNPLAFRYVDRNGQGYLNPNIFKLGSPLVGKCTGR